MKYNLLGKSGLRVSEIALGSMTIGNAWGWGSDKQDSKKIFDFYVDSGGNFIDTACNYQDGISEQYIGEFIKGNRDQYVIATKYTLHDHRYKDDPNAGGNHRKNLIRSIENSLKNLKTSYIDVLYLHAWDYMTPIEEIMRSLNDLVSSTKVNYIAISDTPAWVTATANTIANLRGWEPFTAYQFPYHIAQRDAERDIMPMSRKFDLAMTTWGVLGGGLFTGKYTKQKGATGRIAKGKGQDEKSLVMARKIDEIAEEVGCSSAQVALRWVMNRPGVLIPIIGSTKVEQLKDNLGALNIKLTDDQQQRIDNISDFEKGFPHDFLNSEGVIKVIHGNTYEKVINHRKTFS